MRLASLATALVLVSGCMLVFDGRGSDGDDVSDGGGDECLVPRPATPPALTLRNPDTLDCETWTGGSCNPECGPCPAIAPSLPPPSWGFCGSRCEALSETDCAMAPECRVVKDAVCALSGACNDDFLGCFPTDQFTDSMIDCFTARDAQSCSRNPACTAFHRNFQTIEPPGPVRTFAMCAPEGKSPGTCHGQVTCTRPAPGCPPNARPGIDAGCYTGTCIPVDVCEPAPQP